MTSILAGLRTWRLWHHLKRTAQRRALPVDCNRLHDVLSAKRPDLDRLLDSVRTHGVVAVPDYWTADQCALARAEIDRIIRENPDQVQKHSNGADKRMFGVESASNILMEFHADPFLRQFGELLGGLDIYNFATLAGRIDATSENIGSGAGWHRDANSFQYKSIMYLSDTTAENGPFEYLIASHTSLRAAVDVALADIVNPDSTRFTDEDVGRICARGVERRSFPAKAGTLLLVNTAGIHRGMPLQQGARYALTNYYYHGYEVDEERIEKFSPLIPGAANRIRNDMRAWSATMPRLNGE